MAVGLRQSALQGWCGFVCFCNFVAITNGEKLSQTLRVFTTLFSTAHTSQTSAYIHYLYKSCSEEKLYFSFISLKAYSQT